jgi:hypothetical protein
LRWLLQGWIITGKIENAVREIMKADIQASAYLSAARAVLKYRGGFRYIFTLFRAESGIFLVVIFRTLSGIYPHYLKSDRFFFGFFLAVIKPLSRGRGPAGFGRGEVFDSLL